MLAVYCVLDFVNDMKTRFSSNNGVLFWLAVQSLMDNLDAVKP